MPQIKQQEQSSLKTIRANPVKMDAIMREVEVLKAERHERREAKRERKDARREKKAERREKKNARRGMSESSSSSSRGRRGGANPRRRSRSRSRGSERELERFARVPVTDAACAQRGDAPFGLTFASAQAEAAARANSAQPRHAYVPHAAPVAAPPQSWRKGSNSLRHAPGKLSEAERAARLSAMSADALTHEDERWQRLRHDTLREAADGSARDGADAPSHHHAVKPSFLGDQERALFGADSAMNLSERVGALKHYRERGT